MELPKSTLHLHRKTGQVLIFALILLVLVVLAVEGCLRLAVKSGHMPDPGPGTNNADLNYKLPMLDQLVRVDGPIDCIFIGSSMTNDGIDPEVFSQHYAELSGRKVTCFNFGIGTLTGEIASGMGHILKERYHPAVLIYGTSARDFSKEMGARALRSDQWYLYMLGTWNLPGWLQEHSMVYREYLKLLRDMNPDNRQFVIKVRENTTPYGHFLVHPFVTQLEPGYSIHEQELVKRDFNGLMDLGRMNHNGIEVIVFEVPVHKDFLPVYVNDTLADYYRLFHDPASEILAKYQVPFINTVSGDKFTTMDDEWADMKHLNQKGAVNLSSFLAEAIWQLQQSGQITWSETNADH